MRRTLPTVVLTLATVLTPLTANACSPADGPRPAAAAAATRPGTTLPAAAPGPRTEEQKIEALIAHVRGLGDRVTFVRNGSSHSAADAADHMARKRRAAGDRVKTAATFVEHCATRSGTSGDPYKIRFKAENREVASGEYLTEQLKRIEAGR